MLLIKPTRSDELICKNEKHKVKTDINDQKYMTIDKSVCGNLSLEEQTSESKKNIENLKINEKVKKISVTCIGNRKHYLEKNNLKNFESQCSTLFSIQNKFTKIDTKNSQIFKIKSNINRNSVEQLSNEKTEMRTNQVRNQGIKTIFNLIERNNKSIFNRK